jgi:hypothetical protein
MPKSKWQLKSKYLNAQTIPFCPLDFELDLTFEPWLLTLFGLGIWPMGSR